MFIQMGCYTLNLALLTPVCRLLPARLPRSPSTVGDGRRGQVQAEVKGRVAATERHYTRLPGRLMPGQIDGRGTGQAPPANMGFYKVFNRLEINILRHAEHQYISEI